MEVSGVSDIILILIIGTLGMVIMALGIFFFFLFYQKKLLAHELELNRIKAEQQKELLRISIFAQEKERKRFAEDLHDEIGAMLSAVKLNLGRIEKKSSEPEPKNLASETKSYLDEVILQLRRIIRAMLPPSLEKFGLVQAVSELISWINRTETIDIQLRKSGEVIRFDSKRELAVFRVIQELINNSLKYSGASRIEIAFRFATGALWVMVSDNGKGFNPEEKKGSGLGLQNLQSRASVLNGQLRLKSAPGKGTSTILVLPLNEQTHDS